MHRHRTTSADPRRLAAVRSVRAREGGGMEVQAFVLVIFLALMVAAGLAVDGSGKIQAAQYAQTVAAESARAGAQEILPGPVTGKSPVLDTTRAVQEAQTFMTGFHHDGYDISGTCYAEDNLTIACDTTVVYHTVFLGIITIDTLTVHAHSNAQATRALDGQPR